MPWANVDDAMKDHPKIVAAGAIAELIQYRAIQYCNRFLTDGFVADASVPTLLARLEAFGPQDWAATMVRARLWHRRRGGYQVHDFLDWNLSKASRLAVRNSKRKAGKKGAIATNSKRWRSAAAATDAAPRADTHGVAHATPRHEEEQEQEPVATDGGNASRARARPIGGQNGFHSSGASNPDEAPSPVAGPIQAGAEFERDARAPARGTFEAIQARVMAAHPNLVGPELTRLVLHEFTQVIGAARV